MKIHRYLPTVAELMFGALTLELFLCLVYGIPEFGSLPVSLYLCTALVFASWLVLKREAVLKAEAARIVRERT